MVQSLISLLVCSLCPAHTPASEPGANSPDAFGADKPDTTAVSVLVVLTFACVARGDAV